MAASEHPAEDLVLPFEVKPLGVRGRLVRLGAAVDDILHRHDYPPPVSALLAEAVALTAILGAMLKFDGKFILQTKTDGPVDMVVADYLTPGKLRGYARFEWVVLDWNTPAIEFYDALGARPMKEWTTYRVDGERLGVLAGR